MPPPSPTYLLASAEPALLARIEPVLLSAGAQVAIVLSAEAALAAMTGCNPPDLALVDATLPGMPVQQLLAAVRADESGQRLPIVLIAESITPEWLDRLEEGALDDLLPRDAEGAYWLLRAASVLRARRVRHELGAMRENQASNAQGAQLDPLTGVYNREALLALIFRETDRVQRLHSPLSLLLFGVDDFGHWKARLGVAACDQMLCQALRRAARLLRTYDLLGRTGHDEFLIALPACSVVNAVALAERLRMEVFSVPYRAGDATVRLSACFGIAQSHGRSPVVVLREAEQALARAREAGPESIETFDGSQHAQPAPVTFFSSASGGKWLAW